MMNDNLFLSCAQTAVDRDHNGRAHDVDLPNGAKGLIRLMSQQDRAAVEELVTRMSSDDIQRRFHASSQPSRENSAAALAQIDEVRETAVVLERPAEPNGSEIVAIGQIIRDATGKQGEYALMVRSDMQGFGLGRTTMERLIEIGRQIGMEEIIGEVQRENTAMLALCDNLGFAKELGPDDRSLIEVRLTL
jgi:acetyltransferase